eukprot:1190471-Prorocentrum_minimum.AAC.2
MTDQSDAWCTGIFSRRTDRTHDARVMLLPFTGPPVPTTARMHSTPQRCMLWVYSHDGPMGRRKPKRNER